MLSRLELDGFGSPAEIARRIHELAPDLPLHFTIEDVCRQLDIETIEEMSTTSFEAMLLTDEHKVCGAIVLAEGRKRERRRFSIAHELGHFLIPTHKGHSEDGFSCSIADLRVENTREHNRRQRVEAEANRFAAHLLMPPARIRSGLTFRQPDLREIVHLASEFGVSREAMARGYIDAHRDTLAVVIIHHGRIDRIYRDDDFPWIEPRYGQAVPTDSIATGHHLQPGQCSDMEECDPETWLGDTGSRQAEILSEQILAQQNGWAIILLHAEMSDS